MSPREQLNYEVVVALKKALKEVEQSDVDLERLKKENQEAILWSRRVRQRLVSKAS